MRRRGLLAVLGICLALLPVLPVLNVSLGGDGLT